jgi:hypothetical protein
MKKEQSLTLYRGNVCKPIIGDITIHSVFGKGVLKAIDKKNQTLTIENEKNESFVDKISSFDVIRRKKLKDQISLCNRYPFLTIRPGDYSEKEMKRNNLI